MSRGMIEGLDSANPIGHALPAMFQDDEFALRFVSGLDPSLAPIFTTLDCYDAYLDAGLAPPDFLEWLASWVGVELDENWPIERQRDLVASAVDLYAQRGTVAGLRRLLEIYTGEEPELTDSGGVSWSPVPGGELPGTPEPSLRVRVTADDTDRKRVISLVAAATPAHVIHEVEVVAR